MGAHVFISYAEPDRELADQVAKSLDDAGLTVKRPETKLQGGDRWADAVMTALTDSDLMVIIVPPEGVAGSNNAYFELGVADGLKKPVVAVVKNPVDMPKIKFAPYVPADDISGLINQVQAALNKRR